MRDHLKSIRTREENLDELKRRRKNVGAKAETAERKLSKMSPEHKNLPMQTDTLNSLRAEIRSLDSEIMSEEAALGDFKRITTRAWMGLKFGGLVECAEKGTVSNHALLRSPLMYYLSRSLGSMEDLLSQKYRRNIPSRGYPGAFTTDNQRPSP